MAEWHFQPGEPFLSRPSALSFLPESCIIVFHNLKYLTVKNKCFNLEWSPILQVGQRGAEISERKSSGLGSRPVATETQRLQSEIHSDKTIPLEVRLQAANIMLRIAIPNAVPPHPSVSSLSLLYFHAPIPQPRRNWIETLLTSMGSMLQAT